MVLAHKNSHELLERAGKEALAREILRESVRPLGIEVDDADEEDGHGKAQADDEKPAKKKKKKKAAPANPVKAVHFSNFIIQ
jgi:flagellar FliL protein